MNSSITKGTDEVSDFEEKQQYSFNRTLLKKYSVCHFQLGGDG